MAYLLLFIGLLTFGCKPNIYMCAPKPEDEVRWQEEITNRVNEHDKQLEEFKTWRNLLFPPSPNQ